jgi:glutaredoxin
MSELCAVHKIVAAPDGRCVLCRRPKLLLPSDEEESLGSRTVTALLGLCLLGTIGFAAYTFAAPSAGAARNASSNANVSTVAKPVVAPAKPEQVELDENAPVLLSTRHPSSAHAAASPAAAAKPEVSATAAAEQPAKRKRVRTVGKKIVDPRLIEARKSVRVLMYSAPWCFICDRARTFLEAREVDVVDYNVDLDEDADRRLSQLNPSGSIPTFVVDGKTIVGFHPWGLEDAIDVVAQKNYCTQGEPEQGAVCERLASAK